MDLRFNEMAEQTKTMPDDYPPFVGQYEPGVHGRQSSSEVRDVRLLKVPAGQGLAVAVLVFFGQ